MANDPWGSGSVSWRERMERAYAEFRRRIKLDAQNDPNFVPPRDASDMLASRVFAARENGPGQGTPYNIPNTLVQRDALGDFGARNVQVVALVVTTTAGYDWQLLDPSLAYIARVPTGTKKLEFADSLQVATGFGCNSKTPQVAVSCGAPFAAPTGSMAGISGSAGATYSSAEQALINALVTEVEAHAELLNLIVPAFASLRTTCETMRTALIANGILV